MRGRPYVVIAFALMTTRPVMTAMIIPRARGPHRHGRPAALPATATGSRRLFGSTNDCVNHNGRCLRLYRLPIRLSVWQFAAAHVSLAVSRSRNASERLAHAERARIRRKRSTTRCLQGLLSAPFLLSYSVFVFIFSLFFVSRQMLSAR